MLTDCDTIIVETKAHAIRRGRKRNKKKSLGNRCLPRGTAARIAALREATGGAELGSGKIIFIKNGYTGYLLNILKSTIFFKFEIKAKLYNISVTTHVQTLSSNLRLCLSGRPIRSSVCDEIET